MRLILCPVNTNGCRTNGNPSTVWGIIKSWVVPFATNNFVSWLVALHLRTEYTKIPVMWNNKDLPICKKKDTLWYLSLNMAFWCILVYCHVPASPYYNRTRYQCGSSQRKIDTLYTIIILHTAAHSFSLQRRGAFREQIKGSIIKLPNDKRRHFASKRRPSVIVLLLKCHVIITSMQNAHCLIVPIQWRHMSGMVSNTQQRV